MHFSRIKNLGAPIRPQVFSLPAWSKLKAHLHETPTAMLPVS